MIIRNGEFTEEKERKKKREHLTAPVFLIFLNLLQILCGILSVLFR